MLPVVRGVPLSRAIVRTSDREIQRIVVTFGTSECSCIVRDIRTREIIFGNRSETCCHRSETLPRIRLRERPQMPSRTVLGVGRNRARSKLANRFRPAAGEPVCVGERDEFLRVVRTLFDGSFESGYWIGFVVHVDESI